MAISPESPEFLAFASFARSLGDVELIITRSDTAALLRATASTPAILFVPENLTPAEQGVLGARLARFVIHPDLCTYVC